eukprot:565433-Amphidinium_carterae.2
MNGRETSVKAPPQSRFNTEAWRKDCVSCLELSISALVNVLLPLDSWGGSDDVSACVSAFMIGGWIHWLDHRIVREEMQTLNWSLSASRKQLPNLSGHLPATFCKAPLYADQMALPAYESLTPSRAPDQRSSLCLVFLTSCLSVETHVTVLSSSRGWEASRPGGNTWQGAFDNLESQVARASR